jgi:hypothetical protein
MHTSVVMKPSLLNEEALSERKKIKRTKQIGVVYFSTITKLICGRGFCQNQSNASGTVFWRQK